MTDELKEARWKPLEAEDGVLACVLLDGTMGSVAKCAEHLFAVGVRPEFFTCEFNQNAFGVVKDLYDLGLAADEVTVCNRFKQIYPGKASEMATKVFDLTGRIETTAHFKTWLALFVENWKLGRVIDSCEHIMREGGSDYEKTRAMLTEDLAHVDEITVSAETRDVQEEQRFLASVKKMVTGQETSGTMFLDLLDFREVFTPIHTGEFVVVAARPSQGKSSLLCQIARGNLDMNIVYHTIEDSPDMVRMRMASQETKLSIQKVAGAIQEDKDRWEAECVYLSDRRGKTLFMSTNPSLAAMTLFNDTAAAQCRGSIGAIVVDYIQLVDSGLKKENRTNQIGMVTRTLKQWVQKYDCAVLAASQLSRASEYEGRKPRLSDLRESGSIEQDSDRVLFLHPGKESHVQINQAKMKNGPTGVVDVTFVKEHFKFYNYAPQQEQ